MRERLSDEVSPHPAETAREQDIAAERTNTPAVPLATPHTYTLFGVQRLWRLASGLCLVAAIVLGLRGHLDATFVVATLGVVAWFLDQRNLLRARSIEADVESELEAQDEQ
ncbi:MAG TPA: hypothetical protein VE775_07095 [Pyrinomonadaceae bacterium]|nr:hypothetical protein [Pyrinomonadaceae bacterium]